MNWGWIRKRPEDLLVGIVLVLGMRGVLGIIWHIARGFGLLAWAGHKRLYARWGDRVLAGYAIVAVFLVFVFSDAVQAWVYGIIFNAFESIFQLFVLLSVFAFAVFGFYVIVTSPFRGRRKRSSGK